MQHIKHDLGRRSAGDAIEVTLSHAASVRLMDSSNYQKYSKGRGHEFYGGYCERSPVMVSIPKSDYWYVAVDLDGNAGTVSSSVRVITY